MAAMALWLCGSGPAHAAWSHSITFLGLSDATHPYEQRLSSTIGSALDLWTRHLAGSASFEIEVMLTGDIERAMAHSLTSGYVHDAGPRQVFEQGIAYEIRTGLDPNGSAPDLRILLNGNYLQDELWFDPEPALRSTPVQADKTDAISVFAHELGHALAFNGWSDDSPGGRRLDYGSTWDLNTEYVGSFLYFVGASAMSLYGGPVPVTVGNNWHIGNATGPGADLATDLMNGLAFDRGARYDVSALDLAMLADMGVALAPVPEPQTALMLLAGLACIGRIRQARRQHPTA
jgi:hypothetical protein